MCNSSSRCPVIGRQIRPRPYVAMKLMASGVTFSAAIMRSPSFSRSSSSTMMIMRPSWISVIASSIVANCMGPAQKILDILCQNVELEVHGSAGFSRLQIRILECMRNYSDGKNAAAAQRRDGQADAVHCNGALFDDVTPGGFWILDLQVPGISLAFEVDDSSETVDMPLNDMATETCIRAHR